MAAGLALLLAFLLFQFWGIFRKEEVARHRAEETKQQLAALAVREETLEADIAAHAPLELDLGIVGLAGQLLDLDWLDAIVLAHVAEQNQTEDGQNGRAVFDEPDLPPLGIPVPTEGAPLPRANKPAAGGTFCFLAVLAVNHLFDFRI